MAWTDLLQITLLVLANLGGGGAIIFGLSGFLGRLWADRAAEKLRGETETSLTTLRARIDDGLARLNASLEHQGFLLQRLGDIELQAIQKCWSRAIRARYLLNGIRPHDASTEEAGLKTRLTQLEAAHNRLLPVIGAAEPFLERPISDLLHQIAAVVRLELSQARRDVGSPRWWQQGDENRDKCERLTDALRAAVQLRVAALRSLVEPTRR